MLLALKLHCHTMGMGPSGHWSYARQPKGPITCCCAPAAESLACLDLPELLASYKDGHECSGMLTHMCSAVGRQLHDMPQAESDHKSTISLATASLHPLLEPMASRVSSCNS